MIKSLLSLVGVFVFASYAFAQPLPSDELVRTSTVVPNLSDANSGWQKVGDELGTFSGGEYQGRKVVLRGIRAYYVNEKEGMEAFVYRSKTDANGNSEEFMMQYGTLNVIRGAIKVDGKWYVSKGLYADNGEPNQSAWITNEIIYDERETDKPVKIKFVLETVDGRKEVVFDLELL